MEIVKENLWHTELPVMIVVTTNAVITPQGRLVMGAGAALQAKQHAPELPTQCARKIQRHSAMMPIQIMYGFLEIRPWTRPGKAGFGIFQVKNHFRDKARIDFINFSCQTLAQWMRQSDVPVRMNYPGIGNGQMSRDKVEPILQAHFQGLPITICFQ